MQINWQCRLHPSEINFLANSGSRGGFCCEGICRKQRISAKPAPTSGLVGLESLVDLISDEIAILDKKLLYSNMSRSVRVRVECIETVKLALRRNGYVRQLDLVNEIKFSKNTVNKFFTGKPIDYLNFIEICDKLSLDWQEIAYLEGEDIPQNAAESNTSEQTLSVTVEVDRNLEVNLPDKDDSQTDRAREKRVILQQAIPNVPVWKGRDELLDKLKEKLLLRESLETRFLQETGFLSPPKVLAIIGQGGIGKTSLAVKLIENLTRQPSSLAGKIYDCVMYFKAQEGTSFDDVAEFLLDGLGIETPEPLKTADEKIGKIIAGLAEKRCLLMLDNLESVLHPANHPQAGKAVSLDWGKLLNALVYQQHISQTILTSREVPADLADTRYEGAEPDTELVHIETLTGVSNQAGVEILQQRQLKDKPEDLQWVSGRVEGHVFLLTQLAAIGKGKPGYLRKHPELVTKKAELILQEQLVRQSEAARDLLKRMCVLRVPIDVRGLTFLRVYQDDDSRFKWAEFGEAAELTDEEIRETEAILERLVDSSLVQCRYDEEKCELFYDLHRVIVEFLQGECKEELPNLLESVYKFYCSGKNVEDPKTLEDLRPVLEAQYFAFQLENYSEASRLVMWTLEEYLRTWGYWNLLKDLCEKILPYVDDDDRPVCLRQIGRIYRDIGNWDLAEKYFQDALSIEQEEEDKSGIANSLSCLGDIERNRGNWEEAERLYRQSLQLRTELGDRAGMASSWGVLGDIERNRGNWDEAERLYRQCLQIETELGDLAGMASSWGVLGNIEQNRGNWEEAERLYRQSLQLRTELGDRAGMASSWGVLGDIERNRGNWEEAERLYRQCLEIETELGDRAGIATSWGTLGDIERMRGNFDAAEKFKQQSFQLREELGDREAMAMSLCAWGEIKHARGDYDAAEQLYQKSLQIRQELGTRNGIAIVMGCLGKNKVSQGNLDDAERILKESLVTMEELNMLLEIAEANYDLAQLYRQRNNPELAQQHYNTAHQIFQQLGAAKDLERIEKEWKGNL